MNDYMRALHQRFFREPACAEQRQELEATRQELQKRLIKSERGCSCGYWMPNR